MAQILKPTNLSLTWASGGDVLNPGDTKYATGWQVEIPPRQWFNYLDNRQDTAIAHINQHGIAVWDSTTEYQAGKSYVQGSDGNIYKCLINNTAINPVGDLSGSWTSQFVPSGTETSKGVVQLATNAEAQALTSETKVVTPLTLAEAFKGTNQSLATSGYQKIPGGFIIQWVSAVATGTSHVVTLPVAFTVGLLSCSAIDAESDSVSIKTAAVNTSSSTTITFTFNSNPATFLWFAIGR